MRSCMCLPKFFVYSKKHSTHSEHSGQTMREVIVYKRLKTVGSY